MKNNLKDILIKLKKFNEFEDSIRKNDLLLSPDEKLARLIALIDLAFKITPPEKIEKIRNKKLESLIEIQRKLAFVKTKKIALDY